ncbi:MAG: MucR family transcriptional regulator [Desulfuromonas sp.]|nr:MAG: MucR family transcriptional regulator [Desulfuromonas sp.]
MSKLLEMAVEIVSAHASTTSMTKEDLVAELAEVHTALKAMENGELVAEQQEQEQQPAMSLKKAFGKDKVYCLICGKGMTTLGRHLRLVHEITPAEYRKQFDIPRTQPLAAKAYSEQRKQMAIERGLGEKLAQARAAKKK